MLRSTSLTDADENEKTFQLVHKFGQESGPTDE